MGSPQTQPLWAFTAPRFEKVMTVQSSRTQRSKSVFERRVIRVSRPHRVCSQHFAPTSSSHGLPWAYDYRIHIPGITHPYPYPVCTGTYRPPKKLYPTMFTSSSHRALSLSLCSRVCGALVGNFLKEEKGRRRGILQVLRTGPLGLSVRACT